MLAATAQAHVQIGGGAIDAAHASGETFEPMSIRSVRVGMEKYPGLPFPLQRLMPRKWVAEIVYFPSETALLRAAAKVGCRLLPGTGMAVFQAVKAFELFTGAAPDRASMLRHFAAAGRQAHEG